jgi:hypothetical protein
MGVSVSDIVSAYGANYVNEGQNVQRLLKKMAQKPVTAGHAQSRIIKDTVYRLGNAAMGRIVQPFQKGFTPIGDLTLTAKPIQLHNIKADVLIEPDDIVSSWAGFLADSGNSRKDWPLIRYVMEVFFAESLGRDLELNEYWKGEADAPTTGTPGAISTSMDGLKKTIDAGLTAGDINQILLSATPSASNMFDIVEEFVDGIEEVYRTVPLKLYMSTQKRVDYFRDKRSQVGGNSNYNDTKVMTVDAFPNVEIVGLPSMAGSDYMFGTPVNNYFHIRRTAGFKAPDVQSIDRQVKILSDWWEALGFGIDGLVWAYDTTNAV